MDIDEKLLLSKTDDLFRLCNKYATARFSDFLDGAELSIIDDKTVMPFDCNIAYYGGYDGSEKKILGVFPQWEEPDFNAFPIVCLKVMGGYSRKLTHRDYLGTVMALGITPQKLGDIVVFDEGAYIFIHADVAEYVHDNLHKIGNQGVKTEVISDLTQITVERKYKTIGAICASPRLDAVVGAAANVSRAQASVLINSAKVKLNHRQTAETAKPVKEGDLLSIRGYGRFLVHSFDGETRKQRLHITLKQYI